MKADENDNIEDPFVIPSAVGQLLTPARRMRDNWRRNVRGGGRQAGMQRCSGRNKCCSTGRRCWPSWSRRTWRTGRPSWT